MEESSQNEGIGFIEILSNTYTDREVEVFVHCLMSGNIGPEDTMRSLSAIGQNLDICHEVYTVSETDEEGEMEDFQTSDFQMFINESIEFLLYESDPLGWIAFYRDYLLQIENYELLHTLKLEEKWKF